MSRHESVFGALSADEWIDRTIAQEARSGHHPGRLNGPLSRKAEEVRALARRGGGPVRASVISRWDDERRLKLFITEIGGLEV